MIDESSLKAHVRQKWKKNLLLDDALPPFELSHQNSFVQINFMVCSPSPTPSTTLLFFHLPFIHFISQCTLNIIHVELWRWRRMKIRREIMLYKIHKIHTQLRHSRLTDRPTWLTKNLTQLKWESEYNTQYKKKKERDNLEFCWQ